MVGKEGALEVFFWGGGGGTAIWGINFDAVSTLANANEILLASTFKRSNTV